MHNLQRTIADGSRVSTRGEPWLVLRLDRFERCAIVTLVGTGSGNRGRTLRLVTPFDRLAVLHNRQRIVLRSRASVLRAAALAVADARGWLEPWTALSADTELLNWQAEPAQAAIAGATRLLLADGVGLGKTIQAGLVVSELRLRGLAARALLLTPASLRHQWQSELRDRLGLTSLVIDHEELVRAASALPPGVNPWARSDIVISSIDLVKRPEARRALETVPIDVLVVDEAHHVTPGTDRGAVVAELAARSTWIVLATATPHSGDAAAFAFLSALGADSAAATAQFRRHPADVTTRASRHVHLHRVRATAEERVVLDETLAYAHSLWRHRDTSRRAGAVVASIICRRAVSSNRALARTLVRRRSLLAQGNTAPAAQPLLPWLEEEEGDDAGSDATLGYAVLADTAAELSWLDRLISLAGQRHATSKFEIIGRLLSRAEEPAIVFSEYRDTLTELEERLGPRFTLALVHGGLSPRERREAVRRFVTGRAQVLLATDAAGEGLNLQGRCRLVINVELPWNPVRLEQRIGRVDRMGQTRRVHAVHLCHRDSFEDRVLAALQRRTASAQAALDELPPTDEEIAAAVFDGAPLTAARQQLEPRAHRTGQDAVNLLQLRHRSRALAEKGSGEGRHTAACAGERFNGIATGVTLLFSWLVRDAGKRVVSRHVGGVEVVFSRQRRFRSRDSRQWIRQLAACPAVQRRLLDLRRASCEHTGSAVGATASAVEKRLQVIDSRLRARRPAPFQGSLFDRRAERAALATSASVAAMHAHVARQQSNIASLRAVSIDDAPQLIAGWLRHAE